MNRHASTLFPHSPAKRNRQNAVTSISCTGMHCSDPTIMGADAASRKRGNRLKTTTNSTAMFSTMNSKEFNVKMWEMLFPAEGWK